MRKTTFVRPLCCTVNLFCLLTLGLANLTVLGQSAVSAPVQQPTAAAQPSDPKALLLLAAQLNRLTGDNIKPWHLKVSFTSFDESGKEKDHGTFEEFWVSSTKYKTVRTTSSFSQTDYGTEKGVLRAGERTGPSAVFNEMEDQFNNPVIAGLSERSKVDLQTKDLGGAKLRCLHITFPIETAPGREASGPTYCLDTNLPILRASYYWRGTSQFLRNKLSVLHDRYVAQDIAVFHGGNKYFTAHLDTIEDMKSINDADFVPPHDAMSVPKRITIAAEVAQVQLIKSVPPDYPPIARGTRVSGTVILQAVIGTKGSITSLDVISGPAMLQQAALDAVKKWVYKPYLLNGEPVEALTTVNLNFSL